MIDLTTADRTALDAWYADTVGYSPLEDDPTMPTEALRRMAIEFHSEMERDMITVTYRLSIPGQYRPTTYTTTVSTEADADRLIIALLSRPDCLYAGREE